jgi:predicted phosphodiesterase
MQPARRYIKDLGELTGDVLVFGGPYSNLQATEALFRVARDRNIPATNRICTGDAVAYCANPVETLNLVAGACEWIAGNCEKQLATSADNCGCGFDEGSACDVLSRSWFAFADRKISTAHRREMGNCPDMLLFRHNGSRYAVIHGGVTDVRKFIWPTSKTETFVEEIDAIEAEVGNIDAVLSGHSGIAFERTIQDVRWINAGVIGMPPHDRNRHTQYVVMSESGASIDTLVYDVDSAAAEMKIKGLTQGYEIALKTGIWPSQEILPKEMRI